MATIKKEIKDFDLNSNPADTAELLLQTALGVTQKTTKAALLNEVTTATLSLQTQIDNLDLDYVSEIELANISGILQAQITSNDTDILLLQTQTTTISGDLVTLNQQFLDLDLTYATDIDLVNVSANLQAQITSNDIDILGLVGISGNHESRLLALEDTSDLDANYVNVTGDIMTGNLTISGANLVLPDLITTEENVAQIDDNGNLITSELQELYVPVEEITSSDAIGKKGQWSYGLGFYYTCIATNTWTKHQEIIDVTSNTTSLVQVEIANDLTVTSLSSATGNFLTVGGTGTLIDAGISTTIISTLQSQTATISGDLNTLEQQFADLDLTYATDADLALVSGNLQAQIESNDTDIAGLVAISGNHETRILDLEDTSDLDSKYVEVTGDTMTGSLTISGADLILPDLATSQVHVLNVGTDGKIQVKLSDEAFVPIANITSNDAIGEKGQWSYGIASFTGAIVPSFWFCIASNTWVDFIDRETINSLTDDFITLEDLEEKFIPLTAITDKNSDGIKGQWSYGNGYKYECIATNTWIRYIVVSDFTV